MCIRDSWHSVPGFFFSRTFKIIPDPARKNLLPCLLYTSDAADEEDSVDLGGVRIVQAEDGIRDRSPSRGLGDVYKRQLAFCAGLFLLENLQDHPRSGSQESIT